MDLNAKPYRIFVGVAEHGSFSRAAEALNISQPALSAQLRELERQLGFALFHRTTRRVTLTREGRIFLDYARRMVVESEWMWRSVREIRGRPLLIGVPHHSYLMPDRVALTDSFIAAHADNPVRIVTRHPRQLVEELGQDVLDAVVMLAVSGADGHLAFDHRPTDLHSVPIGRRDVTLAVPAGHALANRSCLTAADLAGEIVLIFSRTHGVGIAEAVTRGLMALGTDVRHAPEEDAASVLRHAARTGALCVDLGWFVQPVAEADRLPMRSIKVDWPLATDLLLLHRADAKPDTLRFVEHCHGWRATGAMDPCVPAHQQAN